MVSCWLICSVTLNLVLLALIWPFSLTPSPDRTDGPRHRLTCPRSWAGAALNGTLGTAVSKSPLSRGLTVGSHPVSLADLLAVVPAASHSEAARVWGPWADLLQPTSSIEFVTSEIANAAAPRQAPRDFSAEPLQVRHAPFADGRTAREVVWEGVESGKTASLSRKMRRHWIWMADAVSAGADTHYTSRQWFVKAETDTFLIPRHLLAMLSHLDPSKPVYVGRRLEGSGCDGIGYASGVLYAVSKPALLALAAGLRRMPGKAEEYEDAMVGCALASMNVTLTDAGNAIWHKRFWNRREALGSSAAPLVALHRTDDQCLLDFRALTNIEFEFSTIRDEKETKRQR